MGFNTYHSFRLGYVFGRIAAIRQHNAAILDKDTNRIENGNKGTG